MSLKKTKSILLKDKEDTVGVIKLASVITSIKPTLGLSKKSEYLAKTAYARGKSKGYTEAMKSLHKK